MKLVVLDGYCLNPGDISWAGFEQLGELTVYERTANDRSHDALIIERAKDAQVVITNKTPLPREILEQLPKIQYVGVLATGYNVVDVRAARELGITVTNIPAYSTDSVGQLAIALLLELCHHAGAHSDSVFRGDWAASADFCYWNYPLVELAGKTMGIIGYGRIGQATGRIAQALGMRVLAHSPSRQPGPVSDTMAYADLDTLLRDSDVISLHCPLTESTQGIIRAETIAKMKDGVMLINTSRGPLIVEQDVADALNSGKLAGAAVDVVSAEPIKAGNPLLKAKNCIITPHIAWAPKEARTRLMDIAVENLKQFLAGKPVNVVS